MSTGWRCALCAIALLLFALTGRASADSPTADRLGDLKIFETRFLKVDQSFSEAARSTAYERLDQLRERAPSLSNAEFELGLAEIAALANNAHSTLYAAGWANRFDALAVRFYIADDGLFIADAQGDYRQWLGHRVSRMGGSSLDELRARWARYERGTQGKQDQTLYYLLEHPALMHAAGLTESPDAVALTLDGGEQIRVTTADWPQAEGVWAVLPQAREQTLSAAGRVHGKPRYLQQADRFFRMESIDDLDTVYLQFRANADFGGETDLRESCDRALTTIKRQRPRFVIVDQRFNVGGDLNNSRALMEGLPDAISENGRIFVITSGRTFSAGISSVGYLKQAGGDRVTIVGRQVGDHLEFWAEGQPVRLPNSGAYIGVATERHNYQTGCAESDCHGSIRRHPIRVASLTPDWQPPWTYADLVAGRDSFLEAVLEQIRASP